MDSSDDDDDCKVIYCKEVARGDCRVKTEAPLTKYRKAEEFSSRDTSPSYSRAVRHNNHHGLISEEEELIGELDRAQIRELNVSEGLKSSQKKKSDDIKLHGKVIKKHKETKSFFKNISILITSERRYKNLSESTRLLLLAELSAARKETARKLSALAEKKKVDTILDVLLKLVRSNEDELSSADKATLFREEIFGRAPDILKFSLSNFSSEKGFKLNYIKDLGSSVALNSLGCSYDPIIGFIFSGGTKVFKCSETGDDMKVLAADLKNPSAISPVIFGEAFAFLSDEGVHLFDLRKKLSTLIWRASKCRGLGITREGNLVLARTGVDGGANLILFNPKTEKVVFSLVFPRNALPSFLQIRDSFVFVTDLGLKKLHIFKVTDALLSFDGCHDLSKYSNFPSGIVVDEQHQLLIAGAEEKALWMFNSSLRKSFKAIVDNFPYGSGIAVSQNGYILVSCRRSHGVRLFKAEPKNDENQILDKFRHITIY